MDFQVRHAFLIVAALIACTCLHVCPASAQEPSPTEYVCPPCPAGCDDTIFDKPGTCPVCNMELIKRPAESMWTDDQSLLNRLQLTMKGFHDAGLFDGAVLVAREGKVIYTDAFGMANHNWSLPNSVETRFRIGSITKTFTAALALMLVDEGKLELHEPITTYLPDYRKDTGDRITLHHLLTHSSGLRGEIDEVPGAEVIPFARADIETVMRRYGMEDLEFEPGSTVRYSNTGMNMVGYIIEKVTGQTYEEFLHERILDPLGMTNTGMATNRDVIEKFASGYNRTMRGMKNPIEVRQLYYASGSLYSTVGDLFKYDRALREGALLSPESLELMHTRHLRVQGYAWSMNDLTGDDGSITRFASHHGGVPGFTARMWRFLADEHCIIVMDNHESRAIYQSAICLALANVLVDESFPFPDVPDLRVYLQVIVNEGVDAAVIKHQSAANEGNVPDISGFDFEMEFMMHLFPGYLQEALEISEFWSRVRPESSRAWALRGDALRSAERFDEARIAYQKALELNKNSRQARDGLNALSSE